MYTKFTLLIPIAISVAIASVYTHAYICGADVGELRQIKV